MRKLLPSIGAVVGPLRFLLVGAFAFLLLFQVRILPGMYGHLADEDADVRSMRWLLLAVSVLVLACVQVVLVCTWKLLGNVADDRIFSEESFRWVDGIVGAVTVAGLLLGGWLVYLFFSWDDPGWGVFTMLLLLGAALLGLLMVVMRELLRQATSLRSDMEAVI